MRRDRGGVVALGLLDAPQGGTGGGVGDVARRTGQRVDGDRRPDQAVGLVESSLVQAQEPEREKQFRDVRRPGSRAPAPLRQARQEQAVGAVEPAELLVEPAEREQELRPDAGILQAPHLLQAAVHQGQDAKGVRRRGGRVPALEEPLHEALDPLRPGRLGERQVATVAEPDGVEGHQGDDGEQSQPRRSTTARACRRTNFPAR